MQVKKSQPQFVINEWENPEKKKTEGKPQKKYLIYRDQCSFKAADISKEENREVVTLGPYDERRKYLTVYNGFNLKGTCQTQGCIGKNKTVWVRKDYGNFDFAKTRFGNICPCCKKGMSSKSFKTFGYRNAKVTFDGGKHVDGNDIMFNWSDEESNGKFVMFKDGEESLCEWNFLTMDVKPI